MATYRYNVVIDVDINTRNAQAGRNQAAGAFAGIQSQARQATGQINKDLDAMNAQIAKSQKGLGMLGQAFKGAFVGAIAGIVFSTIISGITGIIQKTAELGIESVKLAARFELTRNAMTLFTGSARQGQIELAELARLSKVTPGLRLEDAELGATRLRALGFEASVVNKLVVGLAKAKLISGVDDEGATQRVLINLQQLRAGSPQIQRDIQQMILSLPSLSIEINKAFGGIEQFKKALREDPEKALEKFADQMAKTEVPAAGLTDATGKLLDAFTKAGRAFGTPFLDPVTRDFKDLTSYIEANMSTWTQWGQSVADALRGATDAWRGFKSLGDSLGLNIPDEEAGLLRRGLRIGGRALVSASTPVLGHIGTAYSYLTRMGEVDRRRQEALMARENLKRFGEINPRTLSNAANNGFTFDFSKTGSLSDTELAVRERENSDRIIKIKSDEIARKAAVTKSGIDTQLSIAKNALSVELAFRESFIRDTVADEKRYQKEISDIKLKSITGQTEIQMKGIEAQIALAKLDPNGTPEQVQELENQKHKIRIDGQAQYLVEKAQQLRRDREFEKQIEEERRRAFIEFNDLELRGLKARIDARTSDVEKMVSLTGRGYEQLIELSLESTNAITNNIRQNLALQLQDQSLTAEKRVNIEKTANQDIQDAAEQHRQKVGEINARMLDDLAKQIGDRFSSNQASGASRQNIFQTIFDQFSPSPTVGRGFPVVEISKIFGTFGAGPDGNTQDMTALMNGTLSFYDAQSNALKKIHVLQKDALTQELDLNTSLREVEQARVLLQYRMQLMGLESQSRNLQLLQDQATDPAIKDRYQAMWETVNQQAGEIVGKIDAINAGTVKIVTQETLRLDASDKQIANKKQELAINQEIEKQTLKQATQVAEIRATYDSIESGKRDGVLRQIADIDLNRQRTDASIAARQQLVILEDNHLVQLIRETEILKGIAEIRGRELDAILSIDRAQLEINQKLVYSKNQADAKVMDFLANQKGITDIVSDLKINLLTTAYSGLDAVAGRLAKSFGRAKDAVQELISSLLKLALNWAFKKFFGAQGSSSFGSGGPSGTVGVPPPGVAPPPNGFNLGSLTGGFAGGANPLAALSGGFSGGGMGAIGSGTAGGPEAMLGQGDGGLLGQSANQAGASLLSAGSLRKGIGGMAPGIGLALGGSLGGSSAVGNVLGSVGGGLAGLLVGGLITSGSVAGATTGGIFGASAGLFGLSGAATFGIGLAIAGALMLGAWLFGRSAARRRDEKTRNAAMGEALGELDKLIEGVRTDKIDGGQALVQADQIRAKYVEEMSKLKDKKTRTIALKDVSRLDSKIGELKSAVAAQVSRKERLELMTPTFADGGALSGAIRHNPIGFQSGPGTGRSDSMMGYFPASGQVARFSNTEYILDAETTRNVGTRNLDILRATKGQSFGAMRQKMPMISRASGGGFLSPVSMESAGMQTVSGGGQPVTLEVHLNVGLSSEAFAEVISSSIKSNDGSTQQLNSIVKSVKQDGQSELIAVLGELLRQQRN